MEFRTMVRMAVGTLVVMTAAKVVVVQPDRVSAASIQQSPPVSGAAAQVKKGWEPVCKPLSQRTGELGCWITAHTELGVLPRKPIFWHLYTYPTRASGETCLETPERKMAGRAGGAHVIVPGGPPMHLTAAGKETRRALVLVLHDSSKPPTTPAHDWTPKGLCKNLWPNNPSGGDESRKNFSSIRLVRRVAEQR